MWSHLDCGIFAHGSPAELAELTDRVHAYIRTSPGLGIEAIGRAFDMPTSELVLPIRRLIAAKRVRASGERRATKYFHTRTR